MKKKILIIGGILLIIIFFIFLKFYNPNNNNSSLVTANIKEIPTYSTNFTVLPAIIIEEIYNGDKDYNNIQNQINQIKEENLKNVLQANLNQYKKNEDEYFNNLPFDKTQEYTKNLINEKNILPFNSGTFLPVSSFVNVKDGNRYYSTIVYLAYSNLKNNSIDNNNKDIYGISVFNVYSDGQLQSLYISSR